MGLLMEWLKKRSKGRPLLYVLDWIFDLILAGAFIYMSYVYGQYLLKCTCPFCQPHTLPISISINSSIIR